MTTVHHKAESCPAGQAMMRVIVLAARLGDAIADTLELLPGSDLDEWIPQDSGFGAAIDEVESDLRGLSWAIRAAYVPIICVLPSGFRDDAEAHTEIDADEPVGVGT